MSSIVGYNLYGYCENDPVNRTASSNKASGAMMLNSETITTHSRSAALSTGPVELMVHYIAPLYYQGELPLCRAFSEIVARDCTIGRVQDLSSVVKEAEAMSRKSTMAKSQVGFRMGLNADGI